jgi:hypothetical protein
MIAIPLYRYRLVIERRAVEPPQPPTINVRAALFGSAMMLPCVVGAGVLFGFDFAEILGLWSLAVAGAFTGSARRIKRT